MTEDDYTLAYGTHASPEEGRCAMEWVSYLAGEAHSDAPACVSPVLRATCIMLNDGLPDGPRQRLRPHLSRTIGTAGDGVDATRSWIALDWLTRTYAPAWLRLAGLNDAALELAQRPPVVDEQSLQAALPILEQARGHARVTRKAAFAAGANPIAQRVSAVRAARIGREAAWACAGAAAWAGARVMIDGPTGERVRATTRALAGDAAAVAVRRQRTDEVCGRLSGHDARRTALGPTLESLADSAIALLDRMLPTHVGDRDLQAIFSDLEPIEPIELPGGDRRDLVGSGA